MELVVSLGTRPTGICGETCDRNLPDITSWQESIGWIVRQRIDCRKRLNLLSDHAIQSDPNEVNRRWRKNVTLLNACGLALCKRAEQKVPENIRPAGLAAVEQPGHVKRIFIRKPMISAGRRETLIRDVLCNE